MTKTTLEERTNLRRLTCLPKRVYQFLYPFKRHFRCRQGRHFLIFCWFLVCLIMEQGKGTINGLAPVAPRRIRYWAMMRMIGSGQWSAQELLTDMVQQLVVWLPAPADGVLYLIGDSTIKGKRGKKHRLGHKTRMNKVASYTFGFEMMLLVAHWGQYRTGVAAEVIDQGRKGQANILFRQMLRRFEPPGWARQVIVLAAAGLAANQTFRVIKQKKYFFLFALARTRKFSNGKHLRDLARHLPKRLYHRVASYKPDGRRKEYWIFCRQVRLNHLADVTMV